MENAPRLQVCQFKSLGDEFLDKALQSCEFTRNMEIHLDDIEEVEFPDGSEIIHQGDDPDYLYILVSGVCHVIKDG